MIFSKPDSPKTERRGGLSQLLASIALASCVFPLLASSPAFAAPQDEPRVQASDLVYLGAFRLPNDDAIGSSNFNYGGHGLTPYKDPASGKLTLYMEGHAQKSGQVAQVEVPDRFVKSSNWDSLPMARVLQTFHDVTDGKLSSIDPSDPNPKFVYGMLAYNGRLIVGAGNSYSFSQSKSHGVSSLDLASSGDFKGFYSFDGGTVAPPRALGGPMTVIPPEWRSAFGGPALTGQCCISIISTTSAGPSATVFDPDNVGSGNSIPGKTVLFYPLEHPVSGGLGSEASTNDIFNLTTRVGGVVFPPGTRSVLFIGGHGTGNYCYGTAAACGNDTAMADVKGPHAQPYRYQIWAYDANDLAAVRSGSRQTWEPKPYAIWVLSEMPNSWSPNIAGAGYDPATSLLFIAQEYGSKPRIEVYRISISDAPVPPNPPNGLSIN